MESYCIQDVRKLRKQKNYAKAYEILSQYDDFGIGEAPALLEKAHILSEETRYAECENVLQEVSALGGQSGALAKFRLVRLYSKVNDDSAYQNMMVRELFHDVSPTLAKIFASDSFVSRLTTPIAGGHIIASRVHSGGRKHIFEKVRRRGPSSSHEVDINEVISSLDLCQDSISPRYYCSHKSDNYVSMFFDDVMPSRCDFVSQRVDICMLIARYHRAHDLQILRNGIPLCEKITLDAKKKPSIRTVCSLANQLGKGATVEHGVMQLQELGFSCANTFGIDHMRSFFEIISNESVQNLLNENPIVLQHGDLNKTNILFSDRFDSPRIIDWEVAGPGLFGYDFGYFLSHQNVQFNELVMLCEFIGKKYDENYPNVMFAIVFYFLLCSSFLNTGWVKSGGKDTFIRASELLESWVS